MGGDEIKTFGAASVATVQQRPRRFLLLHRKDAPDVAGLNAAVTAALEALSEGKPFILVNAREEWAQNFARCGGWAAWIQDVVMGYDFASGEPRYFGYVAPDETVGKATADIVRLALHNGRPVASWNGAQLGVVSRVVEINEHDYKNGWRIE